MGHTEEQVVLSINEIIDKKNKIETKMILTVEFELDENNIQRKKNSNRRIDVTLVLGGKKQLKQYAAEGFVKMETLYDIHNENFLEYFEKELDTKITLIEKN